MPAPILALVLLASAELTPLPTDVSAASRGVAATAFDPAAAARLDGLELQLRQRGGPRVDGSAGGIGALELGAAAPLWGTLALAAGYAWDGLPRPRAALGSLALGIAPRPGLYVGIAGRLLQPLPRGAALGIVDIGTLLEPTAYLSVSAGIDALNAPDDGERRVPRALRLGVAVRPLAGSPVLTLAADTRASGGLQASWDLIDSRLLVDVSPVAGVHVFAAARQVRRHVEAWAGLSVASWGVQLMGSGRAEPGGAGITAAALTVRAAAAESALPLPTRVVEVLLSGSLAAVGEGWLGGGSVVPMAALQLDRLALSPEVTHVVVRIEELQVALATVDELRAAIWRLRDAGKCVVAELRGGEDRAMMVAAAASRIVMDPLTSLRLDGFAVTAPYFADTLAKIGVRFDAVGIGRYKSGPDFLTRSTPRPEDREVQQALLAEAQAALLAALREDRGLDEAALAAVFAHGSFTAREALEAGLVDALGPGDDPHEVPPRRPARATPDDVAVPSRAWGPAPTIAVVPVLGAMVVAAGDSPLPGRATTAAQTVRQLERALDDPEVIGAVLRVDSPGGDVMAAELIWRAVRRLAAHKPVVASFGDTAASGGYYVAAPAHAIFAAPASITGSIGIFTLRPDVSGLLARLGVHAETYRSTPRADWESPLHPLRDDDRTRVAVTLQAYYDAFVTRVAVGRQLEVARVGELAEGRVYSGRQAQALGLVDQLGGLADALREVRRRAGLAPDAAVALRVPERTLDVAALVRQLTAQAASPSPLGAAIAELQAPLGAWAGRPLALLPQHFALVPASRAAL